MLTLSSTPEYYSQLESSGYMGHHFSQLPNFAGKIHPFLASAKLPLPRSYIRHMTTQGANRFTGTRDSILISRVP